MSLLDGITEVRRQVSKCEDALIILDGYNQQSYPLRKLRNAKRQCDEMISHLKVSLAILSGMWRSILCRILFSGYENSNRDL